MCKVDDSIAGLDVHSCPSMAKTDIKTVIFSIFTLQLVNTKSSTNPGQIADVELKAAAMMSVAWAVAVIRISILLLRRVVNSSAGVRRPVVFRLHRRRGDHVIVQIHVFTAKLVLKNAGQAP